MSLSKRSQLNFWVSCPFKHLFFLALRIKKDEFAHKGLDALYKPVFTLNRANQNRVDRVILLLGRLRDFDVFWCQDWWDRGWQEDIICNLLLWRHQTEAVNAFRMTCMRQMVARGERQRRPYSRRDAWWMSEVKTPGLKLCILLLAVRYLVWGLA